MDYLHDTEVTKEMQSGPGPPRGVALEARATLQNMPPEVLSQVGTHLRDIRDAVSIYCTCKRLRAAIASDNLLWYNLLYHPNDKCFDALATGYKERYGPLQLFYLAYIMPHWSYLILCDRVLQDHGHEVERFLDLKFFERIYPYFFQFLELEEYDADKGYLGSVKRLINGQHGGTRCERCGILGGFLPEWWLARFTFCLNQTKGSNVTKTLCKDCVSILIGCPVVKPLCRFDRTGSGRAKRISCESVTLSIDLTDIRSAAIPLEPEKGRSCQWGPFYPLLGIGPCYPRDDASFIEKFPTLRFIRHNVEALLCNAHVENLVSKLVKPSFHWRLEGLGCSQVYLRSDVEKAVESQKGMPLAEYRHLGMKQVEILPQHRAAIFGKMGDLFKASYVFNAFENNMANLFGLFEKFLDREWEKFTRRPGAISTEQETVVMAEIEPTTYYDIVPRVTLEPYEQPLQSIFDCVRVFPPENCDEGEVMAWISETCTSLLGKLISEDGEVPLSPYPPKVTPNFLHEILWNYTVSTFKFTSNQSNQAGLCAYCLEHDAAFTYYTPYRYAIHLYQHHRRAFFGSDRFSLKQDGFGIVGRQLTKEIIPVSDLEIEIENVDDIKEFGPLCVSKKQTGELEIAGWCYYLLR